MNGGPVKQESLRPHDVCVLLALALEPAETYRQLAETVGLSLGETHNAAKRLELAQLAAPGNAPVNKKGTLEFISYGVPYVFPAQVGGPTRGIPTAFSAPPLQGEISAPEAMVWPSPIGGARGPSLTPLSHTVSHIWKTSQSLYELLALVDAVRVGRARERDRARACLKDILDRRAR